MANRIKLSKAAAMLGISRRTAMRWISSGKLPTTVSHTGRRFVSQDFIDGQLGVQPSSGCRCAIYSRESSSENKAALKSQTNGLRQYASAKGWQTVAVVEEFGSGVNDTRKKLRSLLLKRDFDVLLIEHKDRLTRFGFAWFETICPFRIEVVNRAEEKTNDLMDDLVAILTSFSARLYGQRRGRKKTEAAIRAIKEF